MFESTKYEKILIFRPIADVGGSSLGYLPGDLHSKIGEYFTNIYDTAEFLFKNNKSTHSKKEKKDSRNGFISQQTPAWKIMFDQYRASGIIEFMPLNFIRGRSLRNSIIILDETQNISEDVLRTFLTRISEDSKVILNGDNHQIDDTKLNLFNNALASAVEKMKSSKLSASITLKECLRSPLADEASKLL